MEIKFTAEITVKLIDHLGCDADIAAAAKVLEPEAYTEYLRTHEKHSVGSLSNYMMKHRHGTPFEHGCIRMYVHAPIFVWREWYRHRIGFSYNEESARYKQLDPVFYVPPRDRPMMKVEGWKPGRPKFLTLDEGAAANFPGDQPDATKWRADNTYKNLCDNLKASYEFSYRLYESILKDNIDPGLARDCLPVGIYSSCWVTCNPRSLMAFLSLRTHDPDAKFVSYPLYEIEVAARTAEDILAQGWPLTHQAFVENGRCGP